MCIQASKGEWAGTTWSKGHYGFSIFLLEHLWGTRENKEDEVADVHRNWVFLPSTDIHLCLEHFPEGNVLKITYRVSTTLWTKVSVSMLGNVGSMLHRSVSEHSGWVLQWKNVKWFQTCASLVTSSQLLLLPHWQKSHKSWDLEKDDNLQHKTGLHQHQSTFHNVVVLLQVLLAPTKHCSKVSYIIK